MKTRIPLALLSAAIACALMSLRAAEPLQVCGRLPALGAPDWVRHETIYEVNVRQYSAAGTFAAVEADLPRLKQLGVGVLWFMPIHPIGAVNRKGPLGSPYAVRDYYGVDPEFGTEADFGPVGERRACPGVSRHPRLGRQSHRPGTIPSSRSIPTSMSTTPRDNACPRSAPTGPTWCSSISPTTPCGITRPPR